MGSEATVQILGSVLGSETAAVIAGASTGNSTGASTVPEFSFVVPCLDSLVNWLQGNFGLMLGSAIDLWD